MGEQNVSLLKDRKQMQHFVKALLQDVQALEYMLKNNWFETGITRIGAEQEMCLIDGNYKPDLKAMEALELMKDKEWVETELAKFNLETNLTPRTFEGDCLNLLEKELKHYLDTIYETVDGIDSRILLTGILPTLRKSDLDLKNLTPKERYFALMKALRNMRGDDYHLRIEGIDELLIKHDSPLLEACNTSFQVHLQVDPDNFVKMYNIAQAVAAPVMAIAANSPLLFGKRLWHETRIALFQQSIDTRNSYDHLRDRSPRVTFGNDWLQESILEIYQEDIARFRVLISSNVEEDALGLIKEGKTPKLRALQVHNSTVYRWNRPCYGISPNGQPHLRIENRVFPSGPTVMDEMANTAFWLGLMVGMADEYEDIRNEMSFEDARDNFAKAAQFGIDSKFTWMNDEKVSACDLILEKLLPLSRKGLEKQNVNPADIDRYLSIIQARAEKHTNGARWILRTYTKFRKQTTKDEAITALTSIMTQNQRSGVPVHEWEIPELQSFKEYDITNITVEEFMDTDIFTVQEDDILKLVADMMDWRDIRYTPVEDDNGYLTGLVTSRLLLREFAKTPVDKDIDSLLVKDIMINKPYTVTINDSFQHAMDVMDKHNIGCLPVIKESGELVGIVTEKNFFKMTKRLINRLSV